MSKMDTVLLIMATMFGLAALIGKAGIELRELYWKRKRAAHRDQLEVSMKMWLEVAKSSPRFCVRMKYFDDALEKIGETITVADPTARIEDFYSDITKLPVLRTSSSLEIAHSIIEAHKCYAYRRTEYSIELCKPFKKHYRNMPKREI